MAYDMYILYIYIYIFEKYVCMYVCIFPKVALLCLLNEGRFGRSSRPQEVGLEVLHVHHFLALLILGSWTAFWTLRRLERYLWLWSSCDALGLGSCFLAGCHGLCRTLLILPLCEWRGEMQPFRSGPGRGCWGVCSGSCIIFTVASWLSWRCGFEEGVDRW